MCVLPVHYILSLVHHCLDNFAACVHDCLQVSVAYVRYSLWVLLHKCVCCLCESCVLEALVAICCIFMLCLDVFIIYMLHLVPSVPLSGCMCCLCVELRALYVLTKHWILCSVHLFLDVFTGHIL